MHDPVEVITGELADVKQEVIRQRAEVERAEIRMRKLEEHLDRPLSARLWSLAVFLLAAGGVVTTAGLLIYTVAVIL